VGNVEPLVGVPGIEGDLRLLETRLHSSVASTDPFLAEVAVHLLSAGGKRIRPALAIAAARVGGVEVTDDVILGGISVELVHVGSLYHDDVIEDSATRRGVETVNARWGNVVAILAGDFLLARASEISASLGPEVSGLLGATIGRLCEGQILEIKDAFQVDRSEHTYLESIRGKTASLMSAACRIGALTAGLPRTSIDALTDFGEEFGLVFQIYDDILDVISTDEELGKPAGIDIAGGVYTLPVLRALQDRQAGGDLRALLGRALDPPERDKARTIVKATDGVDQAIAEARRHADAAVAALAPFGENPLAHSLAGLGHRLLDGL
jgi:heptaprenyl diphosphate synthase